MKSMPIASRLVSLSVCLVHAFNAFIGAAVATAADPPLTKPPGSITLNATINDKGAIYSMDEAFDTYSGIRITNGIVEVSKTPYDKPTYTLPPGAVIYPGFIDSHSHAISLRMAAMTSPKGLPYWASLANVNVMMLNPCPAPQPCFQPVWTQTAVEDLLKKQLAIEGQTGAGWVLGWNYEPSRMTCGTEIGFHCANFENQFLGTQTALAALDNISKTTPILVTSESGHVVYVNTPGMAKLNICGAPGATDQCHKPIFNLDFEMSLAAQGQLDEDLALYAIGKVESALANHYAAGTGGSPSDYFDAQIQTALAQYASLGYTTVQEGAASAGEVATYMALARKLAGQGTYLPATVAFLSYDGTAATKIEPSVEAAKGLRSKLTEDGYDMFIAGMKAYSDGSTQAYTGDMTSPVHYANLPQQFRKLIANYDGLPDYGASDMVLAAQKVHEGGFPLWVHTNGNQAQTNVIGALTANRSPNLRDVIVHFAMPTQEQVKAVAANGIGATFLVNDFYYYFQPLCMLSFTEPAATANLYPAKWAGDAGMKYGLHSDASVTPPSAMFGIWTASTRNVQKVGTSHGLTGDCFKEQYSQKIDRKAALYAYTSSAAWLYNRESRIGSLRNGSAGDLVVLNADPYDEKTDLSKVCVLYTIHNGNVVYQAPNCTPPVWPK
jgi:predicted amidohydrolase YtcJ